MNRCVCNGLGAYVDQVDSFPGYLVHECDDHPLPRDEMQETVTDAAARRVDECLDAIATIRDVLWPEANPDAEWNADTIEDVARAIDFLRRQPDSAAISGEGTRELRTTQLRIEGIRAIDDEAALLGTVYIFEVLHHAWFVRVEEQDGDQVAVDDPHRRLEEFQQLDADHGAMQTVTVPGYPGEYVVVIYPAGE